MAKRRHLDNTITIGQLPRGYVESHGNTVVVTPKGVRTTLAEAYKKYNQTHINPNDVPGLTDYLITQDQQDISEQAMMSKRAGDRFVNKLGKERDQALMAIGAGAFGGGALASGLALAPIATLGSIGGGIAGEKVFNNLYGGNWGQDVERWTNGYIPAEYGEYLNPGSLIGGGLGSGLGSQAGRILNKSTRGLRLARAMNRSLANPSTSFKEVLGDANRFPMGYQFTNPFGRYRLGDLEVNNPQLFYRQGSVEMGEQFLRDGVVRAEGSFANPMYASGRLWYGIPNEAMLSERKGDVINTKSGVFNLTKANEVAPKTDLLVSDSTTPMVPANQKSGRKSWIEMPDPDRLSTFVTDDIRRVPALDDVATTANTRLYRFDPNYGYRRVGEYSDVISPFEKPIVDEQGNLTVKPITLLRSLYDRFPFANKMSAIINKGYKRRTNLAEHISDVVKSAKEYPLPKGVSRQDFVTSALYHDLGKTINSSSTHGSTSNYIVDLLGWPTNNNIRNAINFHMNPQELFVGAPSLNRALHAADVGRGRPFKELIQKYPYLDYR